MLAGAIYRAFAGPLFSIFRTHDRLIADPCAVVFFKASLQSLGLRGEGRRVRKVLPAMVYPRETQERHSNKNTIYTASVCLQHFDERFDTIL